MIPCIERWVVNRRNPGDFWTRLYTENVLIYLNGASARQSQSPGSFPFCISPKSPWIRGMIQSIKTFPRRPTAKFQTPVELSSPLLVPVVVQTEISSTIYTASVRKSPIEPPQLFSTFSLSNRLMLPAIFLTLGLFEPAFTRHRCIHL